MESLSYTFEGRGPSFTNDMELQMDDLVRSRNLLKEWDAFEGMGFIGPDLPELSRKSVVLTQCLENSVDDANGDSFKSVPSTSTISLISSMEFGTRFSSSAIKVDDEKLAQSCSKIEKLEASQESKGNQVSAENSAKRARITNSPTQIPVCIVQGCNKDLSNSKEYHKRHKVCEVHSKTAVVIVNGIQQRFCQQCSRFHVLAEFDEGKRSCRKRLAGHNARRRKPQVDTYYGSTLFGTDLSNTSLLFSEMLFGQQSREPTNQIRHVKLEEEPSQTTQLTLPLKFDHSLPKDLFELHEIEKQYPSKNCLNSPLSVLESSAGSNSSCALSLLSAQSQKLSMDYPPILEEYQHTKPSAKMTPKDFTPSIFSSSSGEVNQRFPYTSAPLGFGFPENKLLQEPNTLNPKHYPSHDGANTLDLLQLSLHLQRVEQQKYSSQVKPEDGIFCHCTTT